MEILGYIVWTCMRRFRMPLQGPDPTSWVGTESKAHPWRASNTVTDSSLYSRSPQKSVAKNFRKERKAPQSPGSPQLYDYIVPFPQTLHPRPNTLPLTAYAAEATHMRISIAPRLSLLV